MDEEVCELCGRSSVDTTEHHLIPKQYGGTDGPVAQLCIPCHKQIHAIFTNEELAGFYHTLLRLQEHPTMEKYLKWIRKQAPGKKITIKKSNRKKGR
ncbi:HNH endonuclease [Pontibacillus yanchengensis]|uniref:HNH endonuclease n=1 Tax=Pontibacillus yanchengensis Y32 TaxID=1385514 RepID=A0A0A2TDD9_9BACI|nr:hypothetical protein [Pontibacillus yanchengensis]KGP72121.1 hypothetical protein N782_13890 [Pontibacillus yanchengensis Y32]